MQYATANRGFFLGEINPDCERSMSRAADAALAVGDRAKFDLAVQRLDQLRALRTGVRVAPRANGPESELMRKVRRMDAELGAVLSAIDQQKIRDVIEGRTATPQCRRAAPVGPRCPWCGLPEIADDSDPTGCQCD
jgi:hypothetical protein